MALASQVARLATSVGAELAIGWHVRCAVGTAAAQGWAVANTGASVAIPGAHGTWQGSETGRWADTGVGGVWPGEKKGRWG